jgi:hypothetical protein
LIYLLCFRFAIATPVLWRSSWIKENDWNPDLFMLQALGWEILWPLILGFTLWAVIQAVVSHQEMANPDQSPGRQFGVIRSPRSKR